MLILLFERLVLTGIRSAIHIFSHYTIKMILIEQNTVQAKYRTDS